LLHGWMVMQRPACAASSLAGWVIAKKPAQYPTQDAGQEGEKKPQSQHTSNNPVSKSLQPLQGTSSCEERSERDARRERDTGTQRDEATGGSSTALPIYSVCLNCRSRNTTPNTEISAATKNRAVVPANRNACLVVSVRSIRARIISMAAPLSVVMCCKKAIRSLITSKALSS
jgi:hypothetical protein